MNNHSLQITKRLSALIFFLLFSVSLQAQIKAPKCDRDMVESWKDDNDVEYNALIDKVCGFLDDGKADSAKFYIQKVVNKTPEILYFQGLKDNIELYLKSINEINEDEKTSTTTTPVADPEPAKQEETEIIPPPPPTINQSATVNNSNNNDTSAQKTTGENAPPDTENLKELGLAKVRDFERYIKIIIDKSKPSTDIDIAIENAVELFESEEKTVQASSLATGKKKQAKIRKYLTNLRILSFTKIDIEFAEIYYISDIYKNKNGTYSGVIKYVQKFTGYKDDNKIYEDVTEKTTEVIMRKYTKNIEGEAKEIWEVLLGDINVSETRTQ